MTITEFKAWFEGYTEAMVGPPGEKQWARIVARVKEIDSTSIVNSPVYIERWRPYNPYNPYGTYFNTLTSGTCTGSDTYTGCTTANTSSILSLVNTMGRDDAEADAA